MSIPLWNAVWKAEMPPTRKLVALALADQASDTSGECFPSIPTVAKRCGLSDRAVRGCIRDLESTAVIRSDLRTGRSTVYVFNDPGTWCRGTEKSDIEPRQQVPPPPQQDVPGSGDETPAGDSAPPAAGSAPPRQDVPPTPAAGSAITTNESPIEPPPTQKDWVAPLTFADFWAEYPEKVAKPQCAAKWESKGCAEHAAEIIADVKTRKARDHKWLGGYVPNPLTYLNQERWKDPLPTPRPNTQPSVAERFAGKTYEGTPKHELPEFLR